MLFQCDAQAGDQLLVDRRIGLHAPQQRHRVVDDRPLIVQRPGRILLAGGLVDPGLRQKLGKGVAQAAMVEHDAGDVGEAHVGSADLLRKSVQPLAVVGSHVDQLFQIASALHLHQLDHADHGIVRVARAGGRQVNAHHIVGCTLDRLSDLYLLQRPTALRQVVREHASAFRTDKEAAVLHGELRFGHLLLFLQEELHICDPHAGGATVIQRTGKVGGIALAELSQRLHEHGVEVIAL